MYISQKLIRENKYKLQQVVRLTLLLHFKTQLKTERAIGYL